MTFTARSIDALKAYLRTAAVIDDKVTQTRESAPATPNTPGRIVQRSTESEAPRESSGAPLDGRTLTAAFLDQGILCTVLGSTQVLTDKKKITALLRSDILIVDWKLGDDGTITTRFIHRCAAMHPHALHMICIYTSENDFGAIRQKLEDTDDTLRNIPDLEYIPAFREIQDTPDAYAFGSIYVLIVKKNVEEAKLPGHLLEAFAPLVGGLLRNAVFHSIGAIRNNTHALLDRFHSDLDPAFVTHRVYSNPCEDTEQHIIPLICSEIGNILYQEKISNWLSKKILWDWTNKNNLHDCYKNFLDSIYGNSGTIESVKEFHIKSAVRHILSGISKEYETYNYPHRKKVLQIIQDLKNSTKSANLKKSGMTRFWGAETPSLADVKLSMLMSCVHFYGNTPPIMQSGTIIKEIGSDNYYGCIQPPCDCLRIEQEGRPFLFTPLQEVSIDSSFDISFLFDSTDTPYYLSKHKKAYRVKSIHFIPSTAGENIYAEPSNQGYIFKDADDKEYVFCMQLNEIHALRLIQTYSSDLARIGLMESDWQRRIASKK